jgi:hypothetical protein
MWNENAPLELLKELPVVLNEANLARLQSVIDNDKFINSSECGYDLCGSYAPFCKNCEKVGLQPCAVAYVKDKQAEGYDVKLAYELNKENIAMEEQEQPVEETPIEVTSEKPVEEETPQQPAPQKKSIRIAVAKRRKN